MLVLQVPHIKNQFIGKILKNVIKNYELRTIITFQFVNCHIWTILDNGTIMGECFHTNRIPLATRPRSRAILKIWLDYRSGGWLSWLGKFFLAAHGLTYFWLKMAA